MYTLEEKMIYAVRLSVLYMSVRSMWSTMLFESDSFFCLVVLSIIERKVLKNPTVIVILFMSSFSSVSVCFSHLCILMSSLHNNFNYYSFWVSSCLDKRVRRVE
jgi:hypothetical protein